MRVGSVCSGVGTCELAPPDGWEHAWFSEIDAFPSAILAHRFPNVPNLGDMTKIGAEHGPVDILVGGTPCQSFSVAGLRKGLADPRGNLMLEFLRLAQTLRARWLVWENVPGVLSSNEGRDFGSFLGALGELGYGWAYRILDACHFGLAQRRRRVFVVASLGGGAGPASVLFEPEGVRGDSSAGGEAGPGVAALTAYGVGTCGADDNRAQAGHIFPTLDASTDGTKWGSDQWVDRGHAILSPTVHTGAPFARPGGGRMEHEGYVMQCHGSNVGAMGSLRSGNGNESGGVPFMLCSSDGINADPLTARDGPGNYSKAGNNPRSHHDHIVRTNNTTANGHGVATEAAHTLGADCASSQAANGVRRLTPRECERLQGLPDDWTRVPYRNKPANSCPDGPRYRAIGNGWALPVARWVFERVEMVDRIRREEGSKP